VPTTDEVAYLGAAAVAADTAVRLVVRVSLRAAARRVIAEAT
jgi:hypothetical protein